MSPPPGGACFAGRGHPATWIGQREYHQVPMPEQLPSLATVRLRLRPFRPDDAASVTELLDDRRVSATLATIPYPYLQVYAEQWIATHAALFAERGEIHLAIVLRESDELLGAIGLLVKHSSAPPELGYWLGRRHWARGYATEAAGALVRHAQRTLGFRRIHARCMVHNPASAGVLRKIGFRAVGRAEPIEKDGRLVETDGFRLDVGAGARER